MNWGKDDGEVRSSVVWGSGSRDGDRRLRTPVAVLAAALLVLALPFGAAAGGKDRKPRKGWVAPELVEKAKQDPHATIRVIVQADAGAAAAERATRLLGKLRRKLDFVNAVALELPAGRVDALAKIDGLIVTPDARVRPSDYSADQLWPAAVHAQEVWSTDAAAGPTPPAIAIVDSGIEAGRADFGGRVVADVAITQQTPNSAGDGRGHGTFVASVAAGAAPGYAGVAPTAPIVSLDVMDDAGRGLTSDVIAAAEWIYQHRAEHNLRVANFSLHAATPSNFVRDPLDAAVEKLWFAGVVVVAAAGNYGTADGPSRVRYAPGNDPFVITVGATDVVGTVPTDDDAVAPWSAYGYTYDGFFKPDLSAPGRYMVAAVPVASTLAQERPERVVSPGYMQLSGTSFSAPVVAGAAAQLLARHPSWTPDDVKGALMQAARPLPAVVGHAGGIGSVDVAAAAALEAPPNPNAALNAFVATDPSSGLPVFDGTAWADAASSDVSWDAVSWDAVSWTDVSWEDVSWTDVSWTDVSWTDVSWEDVSWTDSALGDFRVAGPYLKPVTALLP